ncbi:MAG: tyrosine-type recombinase/integrase [Anaerolineae bacterium]|nr:tyrosine-type recombinase/integrase [Anaerolineae bacterium]
MNIKLTEAIDKIMTAKRADQLSTVTLADYERVLSRFSGWYQGDVAGLTRDLVREYVVDLRDTGWSKGTVALHVRYLRAFLRWLHVEGYQRENLALAIAAPKKSIRWETLLSRDEFAQLIAACTGEWGLRDRAIILSLVDTGMRRKEFTMLQRDQVVFDDEGAWALLDAETTKAGESRYVIWGTTSAAALYVYLSSREDADPALWVGEQGSMGYHAVYHMLKRRARDADLNPRRVHPHLLRKMFASWWVESGGDEQRLLTLGGWSGPEMLRVYVRLGALDQLRRGHSNYGPVNNNFGEQL